MVASSKLHHAQTAIQNMLPYENTLEHILKSFLVSTPDADIPFDKPRQVKHVALLVFTSNSSLCGGFNNNVIKKMLDVIKEYKDKGLTDDDILIYPIGRKVEEKRQEDASSRRRQLFATCRQARFGKLSADSYRGRNEVDAW